MKYGENMGGVHEHTGGWHDAMATALLLASGLLAVVLDLVWVITFRKFSVDSKASSGLAAPDYNGTDVPWVLLTLTVTLTLVHWLLSLTRMVWPSLSQGIKTYLWSQFIAITGLWIVGSVTAAYAYTLSTEGRFASAYKDDKASSLAFVPHIGYFATLFFAGAQAAYIYPTLPMLQNAV